MKAKCEYTKHIDVPLFWTLLTWCTGGEVIPAVLDDFFAATTYNKVSIEV